MSYPFIVFLAVIIVTSSSDKLYSGKKVLSTPVLSRYNVPSMYLPLGRADVLNYKKFLMSRPMMRVFDRFSVLRGVGLVWGRVGVVNWVEENSTSSSFTRFSTTF